MLKKIWNRFSSRARTSSSSRNNTTGDEATNDVVVTDVVTELGQALGSELEHMAAAIESAAENLTGESTNDTSEEGDSQKVTAVEITQVQVATRTEKEDEANTDKTVELKLGQLAIKIGSNDEAGVETLVSDVEGQTASEAAQVGKDVEAVLGSTVNVNAVADSDIEETMVEGDLFPPFGVALHVLEDIAAMPQVTDDMTTADVCFKVLIPLTKARECAYHEFLTEKGSVEPGTGRPSVGKANMFLSHAWGYEFKQTIATLSKAARNEEIVPLAERENMYFWMDIVSVNQHQGAHHAHTEHFWNVAFTNAIGSMKRTFFIFDSWKSPWNMKRVWCLWEIMTSIQSSKNRSVLCLFPNQEKLLRDAIFENDGSQFKELLNVDARNAQATVEEDRVKILGVLAQGVGFERVNSTVKEWLQDWLVVQAKKILDEISDDINAIKSKEHLRTPEEVEKARRVLNVYEMTVYLLEQSNRRFQDVVAGYEDCIRLNREFFGDTERDRLVVSTNNLLKVFVNNRLMDKATALVDEGGPNDLVALARQLAVDQPTTLCSVLQNVGAFNGSLNNSGKARAFYEEAVSLGNDILSGWEADGKQDSAEYTNLKGQLLSVKRNIGLMRFASEFATGTTNYLDDVASEMLSEYGVSDWRYLKMRCFAALAFLRLVQPGDLQDESQVSAAVNRLEAVADYIRHVVANLDSNSDLTGVDAWSNLIRAAEYSAAFVGRLGAASKTLKSTWLEVSGLVIDMVENAKNEAQLPTQQHAQVLFSPAIFMRTFGYDVHDPKDLDSLVFFLERAYGVEPDTSIRGQHLLAQLVTVLRARAKLPGAIEEQNEDLKRAEVVLAEYSALLQQDNESDSLSQRRTQLYVAMMTLNSLGASAGVVEAAVRAHAIDDSITAKSESEWTEEEKYVMSCRQYTQFHPGWLNVQEGAALAALGKYPAALECYSRAVHPTGEDGIGGPVPLTDNPFVLLPYGEMMEKAGKPAQDFGEVFADLLRRFGYADQAIGPKALDKWLFAQISHLVKLQERSLSPNSKRRSGWVPNLKSWIKETVLPALMHLTDGSPTVPPGAVPGGGEYDEIVFLAVLVFRTVEACKAVNAGAMENPDSRIMVTPESTVAWIREELDEKYTLAFPEDENALDKEARKAHKMGELMMHVCKDSEAMVFYWDTAWAEMNRLKHTSGLPKLVFAPETLFTYARTIYGQNAASNLKRAVSVLEVGIPALQQSLAVRLRDNQHLLGATRFLIELLFIGLKDFKKVVLWAEILVDIEYYEQHHDEEPSDEWVDVRLITMLLTSYKQAGTSAQIQKVHEIARKHHMFVNVLQVFEQFLS